MQSLLRRLRRLLLSGRSRDVESSAPAERLEAARQRLKATIEPPAREPS